MKKQILLAAFLSCLFVQAQEKVNKAELERLAKEQEASYQEALKNNKTNVLEHTYDAETSFQGFTKENIPVFYSVDSRTQINSMDVDHLYNNSIPGIHATGSGMTGYIWDGGIVRTSHQEFGDRITQVETSGSNSDHATGVAGVMMAAGVNPNAQGMAHEANLKALNFTQGNTLVEILAQSNLPDNQQYMVSNHSYGSLVGWNYKSSSGNWYWYGYPNISETESALFGFYSSDDAIWDNTAYNAPQHSIFKSAGNNRSEGPGTTVDHYALDESGNWQLFSGVYRPDDCTATGGYDCISFAGSVAKNIILVGAVNALGGDNRYNDPSQVVETWFTSFGPTDDGRIKPDITAIGNGVLSPTNSSNSAYLLWSGTSFSSPAAAGVGLLLQQVKNQHDGGYLRSDMMKALLINTANEAGPHLGPDYKFGFGLIDAFRAAQTITNVNGDSYTGDLSVGQGGSFTMNVTALGTEPIKATIAWLDPAGTPSPNLVLNDRTPKLVNDLDLRITQGGTTYYPWKLDPDNPAAAATQEDNIVDNVEQVFIENPVAGQTYTITVTHKGTLTNGSQNFALVVTGIDAPMGTSDLNLEDAVSIYPNPVVEQLNIKLGQKLTNANVKVFNQMGQIAIEKDFNELKNTESIDLKSIPAGVYMVYIKSDQGVLTKKVVKK